MKEKTSIFYISLLLFFALFVGAKFSAQSQTQTLAQDYIFTSGVGTPGWLSPQVSYSNFVSGTGASSYLINLGFDFVFEGRVYKTFSVNTNGHMRLGYTQDYAGDYYNAPFGNTLAARNTPKIVALGARLNGVSCTYGVSGSAPYRVGVYTFEGRGTGYNAQNYQFQIQLYETTGEIRMVYGTGSLSNFQIGISTSASDVVTVNPQNHTANYGTTNTRYSSWPGQYRYYSFTPVNIGCLSPYNLSVAHEGIDSVLLDWEAYRDNDTTARLTYIVEYGLSGFTPGNGRQIAASTKPIYIGGLQSDVNYTFYVRSVCDTFDTSGYSMGRDFVYSSSVMNTCLDFSALKSSGVTCTYGTYQQYGSYSAAFPGPYAYSGVLDDGQNSYGRNFKEGSRHTVHTRQGEYDSCSGYRLLKVPQGECKSVRLGCVYGQYICQAVAYDIAVDTNVSDILLLKYACVMYNPGNSHAAARQPRFVLEILDSVGNPVNVTCGSADFNSGNAASANSGWNQGIGNGIYWKDWTPVGLHLASYHGHSIKVRLTSFACGQGADDHFGYAYYTLNCAKAKIKSSSCVPGNPTTLSAPVGFNYAWYSYADTNTPISYNRQITVTHDTNSYFCDVSFIDNPNCKFRIYHKFSVDPDTIWENIRPVICAGSNYIYNNDTMTTSGTYSYGMLTAGGCDSVLNINLFVRDTLRDTIYRTICAGQTFDTNGHLGCMPVSGHNYPPYYTTGVYTQYLRDTVNGCYQNLVINLTVNDTFRDTVTPVICAGATYTIGDSSYVRSGIYPQYYTSSSNCDSVVVVILTVNDTLRDTISDTVCAGGNLDTNGHLGYLPVGGQNYPPYYNQGVYTQYLRDTATGCFLNLAILLTVNDTLRDTISDTICAGGNLDTNGHMGCVPVSGIDYPPYYNQGIYTQYLRDTTTGCYRNLVILLAANDTLRDTVYREVCAGGSFDTNGQQFRLPGFYSQLLRDTTTGCFNRLYIDLSVNDTLRDTINANICAGGNFDTNGHMGSVPVSGINYQPYYNQGVYTQYLRDTATGCYRNLVILLTVNDTLRDTIYRVICAGGRFDTNGQQYTHPGFYSQLLRNATTGCYNRLYIDLTVSDTLRDTLTTDICVGSVLDTNGVQYDRTGFYSQLLFDSVSGCFTRFYIDLTVNDTIRDTMTTAICVGSVLDTNGVQYYSTGFYSQLLRDSVTGCYKRFYIDLTVNDTIRDTMTTAICVGAVLDTNGVQYDSTGFYSQLLRDTVTGCYTRFYIDLTVNDTIRDTMHLAICAGAVVDTDGVQYSRTGFYNQLLRDPVTGCFTRLYIDLTVLDTIRDTIHATICAGASFDTNGYSYYNQGEYKQYLRDSVSMCYKNLVIYLSVLDTLRDTMHLTLCAGAHFDTNGIRYYRTGFYSQLLQDAVTGCYSRLYIDLNVLDTIRDTVYRTVCAGASFDTNGVQYYIQGVHTQYMRDNVSMCYKNLVIVLTVLDTIRDTVHRTICAGAYFDTNNVRYYNHGFYSQLLQDPTTKCYSRLYVDLTVLDTLRDTVHPNICAGASFDTNGFHYYNQGVYTQLLRDNVSLCYKNLVIDLTVRDTLRDTVYRDICAGASFDTAGSSYYLAGKYTQLFRDSAGCLTALKINLTVRDTLRDTITRTMCAGNVLDTNGSRYTTTGVYRQYLQDPQTRCRKTVLINLTVNDTFRNDISKTLCPGTTFTHAGQTYSLQGTYVQQMYTVLGCDSLTVIHLTVLDTIRDTLHFEVCPAHNVEVNGRTYNSTGWYRQTLTSSHGCDSILHIHVIVNDTIRDTLQYSVCVGKSVDVNGYTYSNQGWYRQNMQTYDGCDSILHIFLRVYSPAVMQAYFKIWPQTISVNNMQIKFSDYSTGNANDRKWIFHEIPARYEDEEVLHHRFAYYTPHYESDSLNVKLVIIDDHGCTDTTYNTYPIVKGEVWVPSVFTPDADQNNRLKVGYDNIESYQMLIYNRSGLLVFKTTDIEEGWDGTHKGKPCPSGAYMYRVIYSTKSRPDNSYEKTGSVLLVR